MSDDPTTYFPDLHIKVTKEPGGTLRSPVPPLDPSWSPLTRLRWSSAVNRVRSGAAIRVVEAPGMKGRYCLSHRGLSWSDMDYSDAWNHINAFAEGYKRGKRDQS